MILNNVNLEKAAAFVEEAKKDKSKAIKMKKVEGSWNFIEGRPQFTSTLEHANGTTVTEADGPPFMGGSGSKPDPVQYCLFGLAACYAQTFASIAAEKGIELKKLKVAAENKINLSKSLGLSNEPIVEKVKLSVDVSSEADKGKLKEIEELAKERCPGVYCLTNPIRLDIELNIQNDNKIKEILEKNRIIAVVGCSRDAEKDAHKVPKFLQEHGYKIIPVNPSADEILGKKAYKSLSEIKEAVDIVDIFRPSKDALEVVREAVKIHPKVIWMQMGIINEEAAKLAERNGIDVVMGKCLKIEYKRLIE